MTPTDLLDHHRAEWTTRPTRRSMPRVGGWRRAEAAMDAVAAKVLEQTIAFRAQLPALLASKRGPWVVFLDEVRGDFPDEDAAFSDAMLRFGPKSGVVVAPVAEQSATPMTASILFGVPSL